MDQITAILEIVRVGTELVTHLIKQVDKEEPEKVVERFKAYAKSVYDEDRAVAEDILEERRRRGEIS